ncbi:hypothetical protein llap_1440 [Limosa lapponica baueri]|uniref:Uncharacterized protein n=1 Tax=Limosa lapponica baueri TaxID=1758121 RepID=A0A2I0UQC8_LIMLA|nr:hypothetical protein llap_1440 [Limosa lapponica baueri]
MLMKFDFVMNSENLDINHSARIDAGVQETTRTDKHLKYNMDQVWNSLLCAVNLTLPPHFGEVTLFIDMDSCIIVRFRDFGPFLFFMEACKISMKYIQYGYFISNGLSNPFVKVYLFSDVGCQMERKTITEIILNKDLWKYFILQSLRTVVAWIMPVPKLLCKHKQSWFLRQLFLQFLKEKLFWIQSVPQPARLQKELGDNFFNEVFLLKRDENWCPVPPFKLDIQATDLTRFKYDCTIRLLFQLNMVEDRNSASHAESQDRPEIIRVYLADFALR